MADLKAGLRRVSPSALREVAVSVPTTKWSDIGGLEDVKQGLKEMVEWPLTIPEAFARMGGAGGWEPPQLNHVCFVLRMQTSSP